MASLICLASQQGKLKFFFTPYSFWTSCSLPSNADECVIVVAQHHMVAWGSQARQKLAAFLNSRPGSGKYHFYGSLLDKAGTSQPTFEGGKLNPISQSEKS